MLDHVLQAISDSTRREILDMLQAGSLSAGEIAANFPDISRPAVSQHLAVLRDANLVHVRKEGRKQLYSLDANPLRVFWEEWLAKYEALWTNKLSDLKRVVEEQSNRHGDE